MNTTEVADNKTFKSLFSDELKSYTTRKMKFFIKETVVTFSEEILKGKLYFLCSDREVSSLNGNGINVNDHLDITEALFNKYFWNTSENIFISYFKVL